MRKIFLVFGIVILGMLVAGCTQSSPSPAPAATVTTVPVPTTAGPQVSVSPGSVIIPNVTPLVIPADGVYVYVDYLGSFAGSYGAPVNLQTVQDSGERLYLLEGMNGTVSAGFAKLDSSTHTLTVRIYENGRILNSGTSDSPRGMVNITAGL
jgi:hypothetical protein